MAVPTIEHLEGHLEGLPVIPCEVARCPRKASALVIWAHHSKMTCEECSVELSDREWLHVSTLFGTKPCFNSDGKALQLLKLKTGLNLAH